MYDTSKTTTIQGAVTSVEWINPHAHLALDTENQDHWALELASVNALMKEGIPRGFVKHGEQVSVTFWPAKDGSRSGYPLTITFADGRMINFPRTWMGVKPRELFPPLKQ